MSLAVVDHPISSAAQSWMRLSTTKNGNAAAPATTCKSGIFQACPVQLLHRPETCACKHCPDDNLSSDQELPNRELARTAYSTPVPLAPPSNPLEQSERAQP